MIRAFFLFFIFPFGFSFFADASGYSSIGFLAPPLRCPTNSPAPGGAQDPLLDQAWHLKKIGAFQAWKLSEGDARVTIAFVDSGINYTNPDLTPNLKWNLPECVQNQVDDDHNRFVDDLLGWDFVKGSNIPFDRSGHGTFLAGLAAAAKDNGIGSAGVCPSCSLLPVRFLNYDGEGDTADAIASIYYAIRMRVAVINLSFAGEGYDADLFEAIKKAGEKDILVVASAGNDGVNVDYDSVYPPKFQLPNQVTVAASDEADALWEGSSWGKQSVHIAAPGVDVLGPWFEKWDTGSGTSDAAAIVSGAAGLLRSIRPDLTALQIKEVLIRSARKSKSLKHKVRSGSVLDLAAAAQCVIEPLLPCLR